MNHEPLNIAGVKSSFSCMYVVGTTYFNECFLFHVIKVYRYSEVVFFCFFFRTTVLLVSLKLRVIQFNQET